jgi:hypothetical protein
VGFAGFAGFFKPAIVLTNFSGNPAVPIDAKCTNPAITKTTGFAGWHGIAETRSHSGAGHTYPANPAHARFV